MFGSPDLAFAPRTRYERRIRRGRVTGRLKVRHPRCEDCGRLVPTYRTPPLCAACATARKVERHA